MKAVKLESRPEGLVVPPERRREMEENVIAEICSALRDTYYQSDVSFVVLEKWTDARNRSHGITVSIDGFEFHLSVRKAE